MKIKKSLVLRLCAFAQACLLLFYCIGQVPVLAASGNDLSFSDLTKLSSLETAIYGSSFKNMPTDKRIGSLERILFGKVQKGPLATRLVAMVSTVNGEHSSLLSPPIAPELDRSNTLTKTPTPPVAPQAAAEANDMYEEMPPTAQEDRIKVMLQQAMQLYSKGQVNQAETMFKNVLALDSRNGDANFNLGAIAEGKGDWQNALRYYQSAASAQPDDKDVQAAVQSMQSKIKAGKLSNASGQSQPNQNQSGELSAQQLDVLRQKVSQAASYYQNGNYDAAISILKEVANQVPDQADIQYALGQAYMAKGQNVDAYSALSRAVALAPSNQDYKNALVNLNQQMSGQMANRPADTFGSNGNRSGNAIANQNNAAQGQITPFSDDSAAGTDERGWQSAAPSTKFFSGSNSFGSGFGYAPSYGYMPGYVSGGYSPFGLGGYGGYGGYGGSAGTAAMAGLAGLALGSMFGLMMSHRHH